MKKLLLSIALGMAAFTLAPAASQAGTFGLFTCSNCGCSSCNFCVKPYNAFTPVCSGNITCMGCMPFACPFPNYSGMGCAAPCPTCPSFGGCPGGCGINGYAATEPMGETIVNQGQNLPPLPPEYAQPSLLPNPLQQPTNVMPPTSRVTNPYGAVQAGYRPAYAPTYNPYMYYNYYAPMGQTPYYWNSK